MVVEPGRDQVEQAAIEIEIDVVERPVIGEAAPVPGPEQLPVGVLHRLVIADAVVAEHQQHPGDERGEQHKADHSRRGSRLPAGAHGAQEAGDDAVGRRRIKVGNLQCHEAISSSAGERRRARQEGGGLGLALATDLVGDQIERTVFHLGEDAADIFADDAEADELHAGEEQHADHDGGETRRAHAEEQCLADEIDAIERGYYGEPDAGQRPDPQRHHGEARQAVDGVAHQPDEGEGADAGGALGHLELDLFLAEADPGGNALHEAVALGQRVDGVDDAAVEQAEVAGALGDMHVAHHAEEMIEAAAEQAPAERIGIARMAHRIHHLGTAPPRLDHLRDDLRRMLEVGIHQHHDFAAGGAKTRRHGGLLAEIAGEIAAPGPPDRGRRAWPEWRNCRRGCHHRRIRTRAACRDRHQA